MLYGLKILLYFLSIIIAFSEIISIKAIHSYYHQAIQIFFINLNLLFLELFFLKII